MAKTAKKPLLNHLLRWLLLLPIPVLWCFASHLGWLDFFEHKTVDWRFRSRGELDAPIKIVYVDIDTDAIQQYRWPWNARRFAQLLDALFDEGHVKAVGIDLVFSENSLPEFGREELVAGRMELGKAIRRHRNVVLAANYVPGPGSMQDLRQFPFVFDGFTDPQKNDLPELPAYPLFVQNNNGGWGIPGIIDTYLGETRSAPFFADTPVCTFYPFSLELALIYWGLTEDAIKRFPDHMEVRRPDGTLVTSIPLLRGQLVEVNWFSPWVSPKNLRCSVANIGDYLTQLQSADSQKQKRGREFFDQFQDAIVLVGPVDVLLQDLNKTSFDEEPVPQVGFHGNMLKTLVTGRYLSHLSARTEDGITILLSVVMCLLATAGGSRSARFKVFAVLLMGGHVVASFFLFSRYHLVLPVVAPLGAAFTTSFTALAWQLIYEEKQKSRIKVLFGAYLSPDLVNRMVESGEDPKLGGAEVEITSFFSDIQDFSAFAELLSPAQLVELMNEYLTVCTDTITEQGGTLDKYVGDAVVAMFGAPLALPDHAYRACVASQLIQLRLAELRGKWSEEGNKWPAIVTHMHTRIGLNSGMTVVGNMGSMTRFNYTMMGDNVNLAARLEGAAKNYGVGTLITEMTKQAAEKHGDRCVFRFLDKIVVKGRSRPVSIFEVVGLRDKLPRATLECVDVFNLGIEHYLKQEWGIAANHFARAATLEPARPSAVTGMDASTVFLKRCSAMMQTPPGKDWDGVFVLKTK
ncbi:MAG: adenylate/guanylate cyclase domain-containing protein [Nibricoccus sp.]